MNEFNSFKEIISFLKQRGERLRPLGDEEIKNIEQILNVKLPDVYRWFLASMGKGAGNYMRGDDVFYDDIFSLNQGVEDLIKENGLDPLPADTFVFWMHQGYQAAYFELNISDNPPVYYFSEGERMKKFVLKEPTLLSFFYSQLQLSYPEYFKVQ